MSFTIKNLREIEDVAPKFGFDQVQEARFGWRDLDAETIGLALHRVKPDCHRPLPIAMSRLRRST
jgi:hypothetical protein